nr:hypothetical protein [Sphingobium subterraneum]
MPDAAIDRFERALAWLSALLLVVVLVALGRGWAHWGEVSPMIWLHLGAVLLALGLTPVLMLNPRGTRRHRQLGWVWCIAMFLTAAASLFVQAIRPGHWSPIHLLSLYTIAAVPMIILLARRHSVAQHRRKVRGMIVGALLIAGFFTFPFGRMLGRWLLG